MMKNIEDIFVFIQSRLDSVRVPQKMIRPFAGSTLLDISIQKVLKSSLISPHNLYLCVYEDELVNIGMKYGINIFHRSKESALEEHDMRRMYEWHDKISFKYAVKINACAPFLKIETIDNFIKRYIEVDSDGLFGVIKKKNYYWDEEKKIITSPPPPGNFMNTKLVETTYEAAHCLYAGSIDKLNQGIWMGSFKNFNDPALFEMDEKEALDIDYKWQFDLYEQLYLKENQ